MTCVRLRSGQHCRKCTGALQPEQWDRSTVQSRYILLNPTCLHCIGVGVRASVRLMMIKFVKIKRFLEILLLGCLVENDWVLLGLDQTGQRSRALPDVRFVKNSLKTTEQPLLDATLIWRTELIETALNALMRKFRGDVGRVSFFIHLRSSFSAPMKCVPLSEQTVAGVLRRETNRSTLIKL